ncbi:MAG: ATP-binding protein [Lachnospiraceae bacterium]|nr:ATP-binding protein [Lachnospiraceae bacterium]
MGTFYAESDRDDTDIIDMSAYAIRWYVVGIPSLALNQCVAFYLQAVGKRVFSNVINHGFTSSDQQFSVRLFIKAPKDKDEQHQITIRFRDNGKPFNIKKRRRLIEEERDDPTGNIGIRLVFGMAENVSYIAAYGMNNTVITL